MAKTKTKKELLEDYLNTEDFEYDINSDPLFAALKDTVSQNAKKSAEDLLGKYSQISGGGSVSSAAMSAASRGANSELSKLGEEIPRLYELAKEIYNDKLAEKESKFRAALDYESHLAKHPNAEEFADGTPSEDTTEPPKPDEPDKIPDEDFSASANDPSGNNGMTSGGLAANGTQKHQMDENVFTMTKKLISTYLSAGQTSRAKSLYSKFKNAMSQAQRSSIDGLFRES